MDPKKPKARILCNKYSKLIIIKSYIDLADEDTLDRMNKAMAGKVIRLS